MTIISGVAWAWGFQDACQGKSIYTGYHLFAGYKLAEYKRGWAAGQRAKTVAKTSQEPAQRKVAA